MDNGRGLLLQTVVLWEQEPSVDELLLGRRYVNGLIRRKTTCAGIPVPCPEHSTIPLTMSKFVEVQIVYLSHVTRKTIVKGFNEVQQVTIT